MHHCPIYSFAQFILCFDIIDHIYAIRVALRLLLRSIPGKPLLLAQPVNVVRRRWSGRRLLVAVIAAGHHASPLSATAATSPVSGCIAAIRAIVHDPVHRFGQIKQPDVATVVAARHRNCKQIANTEL